MGGAAVSERINEETRTEYEHDVHGLGCNPVEI